MQNGATAISNSEDIEFRDAFKNWAEQIKNNQRHIFMEKAKIVEMLKQKNVSAKTKNEMTIILKGLQATVKSVSKVLAKYIG